MPELSRTRLLELLKGSPASAVLFLHGEEEFLREELLGEVLESFLDPSTRDFNFDQLRGSDAGPEHLASLIGTPPMMARHRVLIVREVQGLSPKAREVVEQSADAVPEGLILILTGTIPSGSKAKFYGSLQKKALSVHMAAVDVADLPGWLIQRAEEVHGVELEPDAARALASAIGAQFGILRSELAKLVDYAAGRTRIVRADVEAVCGHIPSVDRWAWFELIGERRFPEAIRLLPALLSAGENGVGLVIGMASQLLRVGLGAAGGKNALEQHLPPYQRWLANRILPQARRWSVAEVDVAIAELRRTDQLLKTASLTDRQALEELLLRLEQGVRRAAA